MKIVNPGQEDYHIHSINFSDGLNTIDEIVIFAGIFGLKRIAITDHSQALLDRFGYHRRGERTLVKRWKDIHNSVEVIFGVEGDLLDESGEISDNIQGMVPELIILSAHPDVYQSSKSTITKGYINAIKKHSDRIKFIGHPCSTYFREFANIKEVVKAANDYGVALEINGSNLVNGNTDMKNLQILLENAAKVYVNSDAHTLYELQNARIVAFEHLKSMGVNL